ncbi:MAG: hypothetical protein HY650_05900 [Acidobacteria bacterium]|nr:hypothetical protein [Acidobacteriota bacterium]
MVCPGCGSRVGREVKDCICGARWIGKPGIEPADSVIRLFNPIVAWALLAAAVVFQSVVLGRALYFTTYRWPVEMVRTALYLAQFLVPAAAIAAFFARRGLRAVSRDPNHFGGRRLCLSAGAVAAVLLLGYSAIVIGHVPRALKNRKIRRIAQTESTMYRLAGVIEAYRIQNGSYPRTLLDLQELDPSLGPILDDWDHEVIYSPVQAQMASRGTPTPFKGFDLTSRGADGLLGTGDDLALKYDRLASATGLTSSGSGAARPDPRRER